MISEEDVKKATQWAEEQNPPAEEPGAMATTEEPGVMTITPAMSKASHKRAEDEAMANAAAVVTDIESAPPLDVSGTNE